MWARHSRGGAGKQDSGRRDARPSGTNKDDGHHERQKIGVRGQDRQPTPMMTGPSANNNMSQPEYNSETTAAGVVPAAFSLRRQKIPNWIG